jgi:hypothetical protein
MVTRVTDSQIFTRVTDCAIFTRVTDSNISFFIVRKTTRVTDTQI